MSLSKPTILQDPIQNTVKPKIKKEPKVPKEPKTPKVPKPKKEPKPIKEPKPKKPPKVVVPKVPRKKNYLNNKDLLAQVVISKEKNQMSNELALMLQMLCRRYGKKGQFASYSYNEDMQSYAMLMLVKSWNGFNPAKSNNPFAYFTQCVKNSFRQFLNLEKKQRTTKNEMLINSGFNPSFGYMLDYEGNHLEHQRNLIEDEANGVYVAYDPIITSIDEVRPPNEEADVITDEAIEESVTTSEPKLD